MTTTNAAFFAIQMTACMNSLTVAGNIPSGSIGFAAIAQDAFDKIALSELNWIFLRIHFQACMHPHKILGESCHQLLIL